MASEKRGWVKWVVGFTLVYLAIFTPIFLSGKNYEFLIYESIVLIVGMLVIFTLKYSNFDKFLLWLLSIWGFLHMLGGAWRIDGAVLYKLKIIELFNGGGDFYILKMDQVIHFYGFMVCGILVFELLTNVMKNKEGLKTLLFVSWIGAMGLGAFNEVIEFTLFNILSNTGVGDVYNTGLDLIFNMFGALFGAFVAYWRSK